jgi:hypothetical protein
MSFLVAAVGLLLLSRLGRALAAALGVVNGQLGRTLQCQVGLATWLASRSGAKPRSAKARCKTGSK